ncbi:MAG: hypothetical protein JKY92_08930 [Magnetovibrio sp.]|nr:hypothetical protein [Magnetovibrio sp.]
MSEKRLSDAVVKAHQIACFEGKKDIALLLFEALELELTRIGGVITDRREQTDLIEGAFDLHEKTFDPIDPSEQKTGF